MAGKLFKVILLILVTSNSGRMQRTEALIHY